MIAIFTPVIGAVSETFIRRHIEQLAPGNVVVVATTDEEPYGQWQVDCPSFIFKNIKPEETFFKRLLNAIKRRLGLPLKKVDKMKLLQQFLKDHHVDKVLIEYLDYGVQYIDFLKKLDLEIYAHAHGMDISMRLQDPKYVEAYKKYNAVDGIITMSHYSANKLKGIGIKDEVLKIIPYGVDLTTAYDKADKPKGKSIDVITVGRMVSKKSPVATVLAFAKVAQQNPHVMLHYVGDGEFYKAVVHLVKIYKLEDRVKLYGAKDNSFVLELMQRADIFLQHSVTCPIDGDTEGLPLAILEAMAYSLPIVTTRHVGIPEAVDHEKTGFLVDEFDVDGMAEYLLQLSQNAELRHNMGQAAHKRWQEHFTWQRQKAQLRELLQPDD